jgi:hypothetical protein
MRRKESGEGEKREVEQKTSLRIRRRTFRSGLFGRRLLSFNSRKTERQAMGTLNTVFHLFSPCLPPRIALRWPLYDSSRLDSTQTQLEPGEKEKLEQCATASRNKSSNDLFIQIKLTSQSFSFSCIMEYLRAYCFPFPSRAAAAAAEKKEPRKQ